MHSVTYFKAPISLHRFGMVTGTIALLSSAVLGVFLSQHIPHQYPLCISACAATFSLIALTIYYTNTKKVTCVYTVEKTSATFPTRFWIAREVALAIFSLLLISGSALGVYHEDFLSQLTHIPINTLPPYAYKCLFALGIILGFRTLIWRPLITIIAEKAIYPIDGKTRPRNFGKEKSITDVFCSEPMKVDPFWEDKKLIYLQAYDGKKIEACMLQGAPNKENSGNVLIVSSAQGDMFQTWGPNSPYFFFDTKIQGWDGSEKIIQNLVDLPGLLSSGFTLVVYNRNGYGGSEPGKKGPRSDFFALEAVLQYTQQTFEGDKISFIGISLGSGPISAICVKYSVKRIVLHIPFANLADVAEKGVARVSYVASKLFRWTISGVLNDAFNYGNDLNLATSKVKDITIIEGENDLFMAGESDTILQAWEKAKGKTVTRSILFPSSRSLGAVNFLNPRPREPMVRLLFNDEMISLYTEMDCEHSLFGIQVLT